MDLKQKQDFLRHLSEYKISIDAPDALPQLLKAPRSAIKVDSSLRDSFGSHQDFWPAMSSIWTVHAQALSDGNLAVLGSLAALASFTASLCIQHAANQAHALQSVEPSMRQVLLIGSSLVNLEDPKFSIATLACCRAYCNLITSNDAIAQTMLSSRIYNEPQDQLFSRLLASPDPEVLQAVLLFILNTISGSADRALQLATSKLGSDVLERITVLARSHFEVEEQGTVKDVSAPPSIVFDLAYATFETFIGLGRSAEVHQALSHPSSVVTPAQIIFLKFCDAYLHAQCQAATSPVRQLSRLATAQLQRCTSSLRAEDRNPDAGDALTFQAAVLLLCCFASIGLGSIEGRQLMLDSVTDATDLLRVCETLSERVTPATSDQVVEPEAVAQLKRNCVKFLGIACWQQRSAQDLIREAGGINLLLNMCQINDANITLREHALLAVRNVLENNALNQDLIAGMKPEYIVGPNGELRDLPPAMRSPDV